MISASSPALRLRVLTRRMLQLGLTGIVGMLALSGCASFSGIDSNKHMAQPGDYAIERSLAGRDGQYVQDDRGAWPSVHWADQFGDPQLSALIAEAMQSSPTLQQAQARVAAAGALVESQGASLLPSVSADATLTRNLFSETTIYPRPTAVRGLPKKMLF